MQDFYDLIMLFISPIFACRHVYLSFILLISMTLGEHIILLRKKKGLSQAELGKAIGSSGDIVGRYERDEVKPSIEVVIKVADTLEVSIDYLVGKTSLELDKATLKRMEEVSGLPVEAKKQIFMVVDALIRDFKAKQAYS